MKVNLVNFYRSAAAAAKAAKCKCHFQFQVKKQSWTAGLRANVK